MKQRFYMLSLIVSLLFLSLYLQSCKNERQNPFQREIENSSSLQLFYVNHTEIKVISEAYQASGTTKEELVEEFIEEMKKEPEDLKYKKAIPDTITLKEFSFSGKQENQLTLYFENNYTSLPKISEVLYRAAIVKTLCQVEGVDYVEFYVNSQPLMDSASIPIGLMQSSDFIDNTGGETNYNQTVTVTLYYTGESKKTLVQSRHQIEYDGTIPLERLVVEQLIAGPLQEEEGLYPTISSGTKLLKISQKDGICYVDFNEKYLEKIPDVSAEITIYSVVNSLAELPGVTKVQFSINGALQKTYRESIPFDGFFERNLDLVEKEG